MCVDFSIYGLIDGSSLITVNRLTYLDNRRSPFWDIYDCATLLAITEPGVPWLANSTCYTQRCYYLGFHQKSKARHLIKKSRDCYKPLGVLKNSFKRVREFYIELKLGSVGSLREGKTGEKPLQQRKNQRRNLDFGFRSLAGFRIPQKKIQGISIPEGKISRVQNPDYLPLGEVFISRAGTRGPLIFRPKWGPKGLKKVFGGWPPPPPPPPISSLSQGVDDRAPPYLQVWIRLWCLVWFTGSI